MHVVVDTNVLIVANRDKNKCPQASDLCIEACSRKLREIQLQDIVVLDNHWLIIKEYRHQVSEKGQPGVGDAFLKWILTNQRNPKRCTVVLITPLDSNKINFQEIPQDSTLEKFDPSDRKFLAVAIADPEKPPILNASDSDWKNFEEVLLKIGIKVEFLCPELMPQAKS